MTVRHAHLSWALIAGLLMPGVVLADEPPSPAPPSSTTRQKALAPSAQAAPSGSSDELLSSLPALQPGLWEYRQTRVFSGGGTPRTTTTRKCSDPKAEFERKLAALRGRGCVFTPFRQHGNRYEATWRCDLGEGRILAMHDIVTVNGPTSYQDESEAVIAHDTTQSSIIANRVDDCPTPSSADDSARSSVPRAER